MKEHNNVIWGTKCTCGKDNFILQNKFHPWDNTDFVISLKCDNCGSPVIIDRLKAALYYNSKIYDYFSDVKGDILDIGCGSGFLTKYILNNVAYKKVYGVDVDASCIEDLEEELKNEQFDLRIEDLKDIKSIYQNIALDYIVCRDVLMYIDDLDSFIDDLSELKATKIEFMGWFKPANKRIRNTMSPEEICQRLKSNGWNTNIEYLEWYKCGYFIKANR